MKPEGVVIYHKAANMMFKKTIEKDEEPKGKTMSLEQELVRINEDKLLAEIEELKSQVADLQEELGNVLDIKNRQAWEIRFLKEDIARMSAKRYEKCAGMRMKDTEED